MRVLLILILLSFLAASALVVVAPLSAAHDPCDSHGDCVSGSVVYIRANPGHTLYLGDSFSVPLSVTTGPNTTGYAVSWSYDSFIFTKSGDTFTVAGNETGAFSIAESVTFTGPAFNSTLTVSQSVAIIQLSIALQTRLVNVTDSHGSVERNLDGSFYHNDTFCDSWTATFPFASARTDIRINVTSIPSPPLRVLNYSTDSLGRTGRFCYVVETSSAYKPYNVTLVTRALNWEGVSLALKDGNQPFAVVHYHPYFTYFTYMLYNSRNSSTYARPFVTLVRYGGNDPGYSYSGDANTAAITAGNDTGERALINNFSFFTQGWNASVHLTSANVGQDIRFNGSPVSILYEDLNRTYPLITWQDRVQKYYFLGNTSEFEGYAPDGVVYFNLTESAYSADFAGAPRRPLFNTTYLYEPVQYSGYLVFKFSDSNGNPDLTANVTIVSHNPSPLDVYLIGRVKARFGDDPAVLNAFTKDLYPSNYTMSLKQLKPNHNGTIVYLVNQTNLALPGEAAFPSFNVTVYSAFTGTSYTFTDQPPYFTAATTTYCSGPYQLPPWIRFFFNYFRTTCKETSYSVPGAYSLFLLGNDALPSSPFPSATAYYVAPDFTSLSLPVNSTLSGGQAYYLNWYANSGQGPAINPNNPLSQEPGHLTTLYQLVYGENSTVDVNTEGGGVGILSQQEEGNGGVYQFTLSFGPQSGGAARIWAVDSKGATLINETLPPTTSSLSSFSPPGYYGDYSVAIPVAGNGTMTMALVNAWGAKTIVRGVPINVEASQAPRIPWGFVTLVTIVLLGIGALASLLRLRVVQRKASF